MTAAEVDPFHPGQPFAELLLDDFQCLSQRFRALFAKRVEVQSLQPLQLFGAEIAALDAET